MLRSLLIIFLVVVETGFMCLVAIIVSFFDSTGNLFHSVAKAWAKGILFTSRIKVEVKGLSNIDPSQSYIYMPNHLSNYDIPVLLANLPVQFRWLAKAELYKIPIFGLTLKRAGYISIERSNLRSAIGSLDHAAETIRNGVSVLIFPEGTRSLDGNLKSFKKGGFVIAAKGKIPILPIAVHGTWEIMSKKGLNIQPGNAVIEILEPIWPQISGPTSKVRDHLMERVRDTIQDAITKWEENEKPY